MNESEEYRRARKRVESIKGFYVHLFVFALVNGGLLVLNLISSPNELWFYWVTFGWGIGLVAHFLAVFGVGGWLGREWEERKIKKIIEKEKKR